MGDLFQRSIEIILRNQSPSGAYPASPHFATYRYCWFRDGAFIAYAMDLVGEHGSAARFHDWAATIVNTRDQVVAQAIAKAQRGEPLDASDILHARYALDGSEASQEDWPNFQLDGFGTWLWALNEHRRLGQTPLSAGWLRAADLIADYLTALWPHPCYDCWEEFPDRIHTYTLAVIYAGLQAHARMCGRAHGGTLAKIWRFLHERTVANGHLTKFADSTDVDASLLGLAVPYQVIRPDEPLMRTTVARLEAELRRGGGLHRYTADTYYGGGEWVLLTAWLGWYYAEIGERDKAQAALRWVEAQADADGHLPEQVSTHLLAPEHYAEWEARWGPVANPLLWSHAMYLILCRALEAPA